MKSSWNTGRVTLDMVFTRMSSSKTGAFAALCVGLLVSTPALAREPFDDAFFVRHASAAADMLKDRAVCSDEAQNLGSTASAYSDPEYGALSAMGQQLDSDQLHDGGLRKRLVRAVFVDCMKKRGWSPMDPTPEEARSIGHASLRRPDALDAWLKAHEPPLPAPAPAPATPASSAPRSAAPASIPVAAQSATPAAH